MSLLQTIGLKLLGEKALAEIKGEVAKITERTTRETIEREIPTRAINDLVGRGRLEQFFHATLEARAKAGPNQVTSALLRGIVGEGAFGIECAAREAEASGEGFMKKKAHVLRVVKEVAPQLTKSQQQLVIELAVQLIKE
ncbi:hypothetical protein [Pseudomonas phage D6]|nr:hypothetical protein [Pseudomonas phage D6]